MKDIMNKRILEFVFIDMKPESYIMNKIENSIKIVWNGGRLWALNAINLSVRGLVAVVQGFLYPTVSGESFLIFLHQRRFFVYRRFIFYSRREAVV
jgi:hypothetical protein